MTAVLGHAVWLLALVQAVLAAFPKARITAVRTPAEAQDQAADGALAPMPEADEMPEDWDPFEEQ